MKTLLVCKDIIPKKVLLEWEKVKGATVQFSSCTGLEESQVVVYKIPDGEFYGLVELKDLQSIVNGSADELKMQTAFLFDVENKKYISEPRYRQRVAEFVQQIEQLKHFDAKHIEDEVIEFQKEKSISIEEVEQPLKIALMGTLKGPGLIDVMVAFGHKETVARLKKYLRNYKRRF